MNLSFYSVSAQGFFQKPLLFGQFLVSEASQNQEGGVPRAMDAWRLFGGWYYGVVAE